MPDVYHAAVAADLPVLVELVEPVELAELADQRRH